VGKKSPKTGEADVPTLLKELIQDAEKLIGQHFQLFRSEVLQELDRAKNAALSMGAGGGLVAAGGVLSTLMVVHALHEATGLPLWSCYGLVGGLLGGVGAALLARGRKEATNVQLLPPPRTAEAVQENLSWLKEQVTPAGT
jgi:hypothetical protein